MSVDVAGIVDSGGGLAIPVFVPQTGQLDVLERIAQGVEKLGESTKKAGDDAEKAKSGWDRANEAVKKAADTFNEAYEAAGRIAEGINALITGVTALADEQGRLDESSARLGLDFDEAAASAGRFADETEAMAAANAFAQASVRLTQEELNALERVAGTASRTLGTTTKQATEQLTQALIAGSAEGLNRFGGALAAAAEGGSTLEERLRALVTQAGHTTQATDSAADAQARFRDAIEDSERVFATAFVTGLSRLAQVGSTADEASTKLGEMRTEIAAAGDAAAEVVARVGNGIGVVIGFVGTGVGTVLAGIASIAAGLQALTSGDVRGAGTAASSAFERSMTEGLAGSSFNFMRERIARLEALSADDEGRTSMAAPDAAADMVIGADEARAAEQDRRVRRRRTGGGGQTKAEKNALGLGMERAIRGEGDLSAEIRGITGVSNDDAAAPAEDPLAAIDRRNRELTQRRPGSTAGDMMDARETSRRQRELSARLDAEQSYTDRMRDMHGERMSAAQAEAEAVTTGFNAMGGALAKHVQAFATGREGIGEAAQGMLADMLSSLGQEAIVKGAMQMAEGAAMLAGIYTAPLAAGHFAAGAAFLGVGALAAAAGAAISPAPPVPSAAGGGASVSRGTTNSDRVFGKPSSDNASGPAIVQHFYAPVIGGREASDAQVGARMERYTDATSRRQQRDRRAA